MEQSRMRRSPGVQEVEAFQMNSARLQKKKARTHQQDGVIVDAVLPLDGEDISFISRMYESVMHLSRKC